MNNSVTKQKNTGYTLDGAMAGYAIASARQLVRVPEGVAAATHRSALLRRMDGLRCVA